MEIDGLLLARIQFAFTVTFHIIFPSFTIGLAAFIATLLVRWRMTGREHCMRLARFWTKVFAVSFAMGVVSGIVMSYEFGTNWSQFSVVVGNVVGPLIGYEVLTAFFLEATFLGIMLFGWSRVPPGPARALRHPGRDRHLAVGVLDPRRQQLDADAGRPRDPRRHRLSRRLDRGHLQSELPLPLRPHVHGGLSHDLARGAGGRRALPRSRAASSRRRRRCCAWGSAWSRS